MHISFPSHCMTGVQSYPMLIAIFYVIILTIGDSVLLGGFELGDEVLGFFGVDKKIVECRSDEYFILYDRNELWVEIVMIHI